MYAYRKKNLTAQPKVFFRFASKYLDFCVVATPSLREIKGHSIITTYCTTYFLQQKFQKGVYHRLKAIFNLISEVLISNANLRKFKTQSFRTKDFRKRFSIESFKCVLVLRKKIFSNAQVKFLFLQTLKYWHFFRSCQCRVQKDQGLQFGEKKFKHIICI